MKFFVMRTACPAKNQRSFFDKADGDVNRVGADELQAMYWGA